MSLSSIFTPLAFAAPGSRRLGLGLLAGGGCWGMLEKMLLKALAVCISRDAMAMAPQG